MVNVSTGKSAIPVDARHENFLTRADRLCQTGKDLEERQIDPPKLLAFINWTQEKVCFVLTYYSQCLKKHPKVIASKG